MVEMIDAPWAGRPVRIRWRKRRWICLEDVCAVVSFIEQAPQVQPVLAQAAGDPSSCHACHGIAPRKGDRTRSGSL